MSSHSDHTSLSANTPDADDESRTQANNNPPTFDSAQVLREVVTVFQAHSRQITVYLDPYSMLPPMPDPSGQLSTDIEILVQVANGHIARNTTGDQFVHTITERIQRLIDLLFMPPAGLHAAPIPRTFWNATATGQLLVRVLNWLERDDLISTLVTRSLPVQMPGHHVLEGGELRLDLHGKTLPVPFVKGLMGSVIALFGYVGGTPELLRLAVADLLPALQRWQDWVSLTATLNPLCAYYRSDMGIPESIDYVFLERLRQAIRMLYPHGHHYLARQVGWNWWLSDYPLTRRWYSSYSLQYLLGHAIVQSLQHTRLPAPATYPVGDMRFSWAEEQRVRAACRSFAQTLQSEAGITCTVSERQRLVVIRFLECPFCANKHNDCNILFGMTERMLLWLFGVQGMDTAVQGQPAIWAELTDGLMDVRIAQDNSHIIAIVFAPIEHRA
ncbi:MAG: hypothetical protein HC837_06220 [Chloroflexaceae bacterium]|nr:hypothetical protein [Chloroflexaceae bacterium]